MYVETTTIVNKELLLVCILFFGLMAVVGLLILIAKYKLYGLVKVIFLLVIALLSGFLYIMFTSKYTERDSTEDRLDSVNDYRRRNRRKSKSRRTKRVTYNDNLDINNDLNVDEVYYWTA